jgi:N-acetylglutamate synthase-like GNAT family acetyltransferase
VRDGDPERADLVVVGWDRSLDYEKLRRAVILVQRGARLVATNADASYPGPDGMWPGAGALLAAVTTATGATATIVGKPSRPMFDVAAERLRSPGRAAPLMVGDRLDTDISGAAEAGWDCLLVWSGVSQPSDLIAAQDLPTYVAADVAAVLRDLPPGRFRPARRGDTRAVADLLVSSSLAAAGVQSRMGSTLVCERPEGGLAATASVEQSNGLGLLRSVAVAPDLRGSGLGMLAVGAAVRAGRNHGLKRVFLFTDTASAFFERLGFHALNRDDLPDPIRLWSQAREECAASAIAMVTEVPQ